jgi:16S rRNA (cytidine1402-2'-O)-methyltransferase
MLVLVPSPLSQTAPCLPILNADLPLVRNIRTWVVENAKPARAALAIIGMPVAINTLTLLEAAHCTHEQRDALLKASTADTPLGIMSDAGCPGIADPGTDWVLRAHQLNIPVQPLVGPSSPTLALMASGLPGQCFVFHGYPPIQAQECMAWIHSTQHRPSGSGKPAKPCTHIAIETPFRNTRFLKTLIQTLDSKSLLCIAQDLHGQKARILTYTIGQWQQHEQEENPALDLGKTPCIFLWQHPA